MPAAGTIGSEVATHTSVSMMMFIEQMIAYTQSNTKLLITSPCVQVMRNCVGPGEVETEGMEPTELPQLLI
jgi:hypothetical protein